MKGIVLCAGFGTRLGHLTSDVPKPMLSIAGEPLIAHTLRHLAREGVTDVAVNLHYRGEQIRAFVGDGSQFGVRVRYSEEQTPLGTAGAVRKLRDFFRGESAFLVLYGDVLTDQPLAPLLERHRAARADATLLVHQRVGSNSRLHLDEAGRVVGFAERPADAAAATEPSWVNSGMHVVHERTIELIPEGVVDFPRDVFVPNVETHRFYAVPLSGFRCAIDSPDRYREANEAVASGRYGIRP